MCLSMRLGIGLAIVLCFSCGSAARGQWSELAAKAPATSNALVLMDVEKVMASPIAQREGWKDRFDKVFASGVISTPPDTKRLLIAAQLDYETWQPVSELAVLDLSRDVLMAGLARQTKGTPDTVENLAALVLPQDAYIVALDKRRVAAMSPANRQVMARWLRESANRAEPVLSPYLMDAVAAASKIEIVQVLDMADAVPADVILAKLNVSGVVGKSKPKVDTKRLTSLLATLKGVLFEVTFKEETHARFVVDFDQDTAPLAAIGKPLLLELLSELGARIADFDDWTPRVEGKRFSLTGKLTAEGMRKVLSVIDAPISAIVSPPNKAGGNNANDSGGTQNDTGMEQMGEASKAYFQAIVSIFDQLRHEAKDSVTLGQNAAWIDRWARKIERLPTLNVDGELLDYGANVVAGLRASSGALKGIGINTGARIAQNNASGSGRYSSYGGYYGFGSTKSQDLAVRAEEKAVGASNALGTFGQMQSATVDIRRQMTDRYKIQF